MEKFSAWKAEVNDFVNIYFLFASTLVSAATGRCVLRSDRRLIAQSFKKELCKGGRFSLDLLKAEPHHG